MNHFSSTEFRFAPSPSGLKLVVFGHMQMRCMVIMLTIMQR